MIRIRAKAITIASVLAVGMLANIVPAPAQAACKLWDVSGQWRAVQSNGSHATFTVRQAGTQIQGEGFYYFKFTSLRAESASEVRGSIDGTLHGNRLEFSAYWPHSNAVGVYTGTIGPQGRVEGATFDRNRPSSRASWYSERTMKCADKPASGSGKPIRALGRRPK